MLCCLKKAEKRLHSWPLLVRSRPQLSSTGFIAAYKSCRRVLVVSEWTACCFKRVLRVRTLLRQNATSIALI